MRLIDADALEELFREGIRHIAKRPEVDDSLERMVRASAMLIEIIDNMPTVDAEPVKHGRWEPSPYLHGMFKCSKCGDEWGASAKMVPMRYCPECGAKMDEEGEDGKAD